MTIATTHTTPTGFTDPMPDWHEIDTVFLDMDGTLLDLHFDNFFWQIHVPHRYAEHHGLSLESARAHILPHMRAIQGSLDWYNLHYWSDYLHLDIPVLKQEVSHLIRLRPGVTDFLCWLQSTDKSRVLTTNAHRDVIELKFSHVTLGPYFHQLVSSHELACCKETVEFWQALKTRIGFDGHHSLLIDDNVKVLDAARDFGIGWLLTIHQPDLKGPPQPTTNYPAVRDFHQIIPPV